MSQCLGSQWFGNDSGFKAYCDYYLQGVARAFTSRVMFYVNNKTDYETWDIRFCLDDAVGSPRAIDNTTISKFVVDLLSTFLTNGSMVSCYTMRLRVHPANSGESVSLKAPEDVPEVWNFEPTMIVELVSKAKSA